MPLDNESSAHITKITVVTSGDIGAINNNQGINTDSVAVSATTNISSIAANVEANVNNLSLNESASVGTLGFQTHPQVKRSIHTNSGYSSGNHNELTNLDYEHSGHVGFASAQALSTKQDKISLGATLR